MYTFRERLGRRGVLVVGPNPTFMEYVSHVLPALGEEAVEQRAVSELLDGVAVTREEAPDVARLKGDPRLAQVVARAVELAVEPAPEELVVYVDGEYPRVREREVRELLDEALASEGGLVPARERLRVELVRRFYADYGARLGAERVPERRRDRARAPPQGAADRSTSTACSGCRSRTRSSAGC